MKLLLSTLVVLMTLSTAVSAKAPGHDWKRCAFQGN